MDPFLKFVDTIYADIDPVSIMLYKAIGSVKHYLSEFSSVDEINVSIDDITVISNQLNSIMGGTLDELI